MTVALTRFAQLLDWLISWRKRWPRYTPTTVLQNSECALCPLFSQSLELTAAEMAQAAADLVAREREILSLQASANPDVR